MLKRKKTRIKIVSIFLMFSIILPSTMVFGQTEGNKKDYYYEGVAAAERDYSGGGALSGGLAAGFLLGLIGWGLGYLVVSNQNIDVPYRYLSDLENKDRFQFEEGYKTTVKKLRNGKYNMGGGIGTLGAVVLLMSASE